MRRHLVAGNWKMNLTRETARSLIADISKGLPDTLQSDVLVCPPFVSLATVAESLAGTRITLGAQTVSEHEAGAYTGEVSVAMLKDVCCQYAIVGHSERRALYREDNDTVAAKFVAAGRGGLRPILCVGETLDEHEADGTAYIVRRQIDAVLKAGGVGMFADAVIAYEPVWAIGTGRTATPDHVQEVHAFIRSLIADQDEGIAAALRILYGGSVKPSNATELFGQPDVDGGLIGGAALQAESFVAICKAAG